MILEDVTVFIIIGMLICAGGVLAYILLKFLGYVLIGVCMGFLAVVVALGVVFASVAQGLYEWVCDKIK